ncbi:hypothetical protein MKW98_001442 [Papaver atlanticum]|uniref:FBD domain-containing protein n=1 Tax=Papaver atlanticum TaxID=357466 RepID=A0AAD4XLL1_9MAGN|nr:hypothetical protein MKW98_001442 [Papaver atlanticum]
MSLPQLKVLNFYGLSISGVEFSKTLLSSCPVLKTLCIEECVIPTDNRMNLIVDSLSLRLFEYTCCRTQLLPQNDTMADIIKLNSPNLEYFTFKSLLTHDYSLEICSPLFEVFLSVSLKGLEESENADTYLELSSTEKAVYAKRTLKYLGAVYMVTEMTLSPGFPEVLSQSPDLFVCEPPWLRNLHLLTMVIWCTRVCLRSIAYLLNISPNITRLVLISEEEVNLADVGDDWEAGLSFPGVLSHLKSVQFEEVEGCDAELKLLSFLLKNAKVLQKVVVCFRSSSGSRVVRMRQVKQFEDKIRAVPTASSGIEMVFE